MGSVKGLGKLVAFSQIVCIQYRILVAVPRFHDCMLSLAFETFQYVRFNV